MRKDRLILFLAIVLVLGFFQKTEATEISDITVDPKTGFDILQEPFSEFLDKATKIDVEKGSSTETVLSTKVEEAKASWSKANDWIKEKTGLDIWGCLKVVGNILIFVMNIAVNVLTGMIDALKWLISFIPSSSS
ncbi:MAG: hypothetical protein AAB691_00970 [Patescibacteria group bacterium]